MKVAVTGAGGYIGRFVVKTLADQGHEVVAIDFVHQGIDERAKICDVNIFSGEPDVYEKMGCPDSVIHLAWKDGFVHNSNAHMDNLSSHYKFLRNLVDAGCKNISVMGTMHEIGFYEGKIDENTPCNPLSQYGIAKNALRQALLTYTKDKDLFLLSFHADCTPILVYCKDQKIVCAIHSGWLGTVRQIVDHTIRYLIEKENCNPKEMYL